MELLLEVISAERHTLGDKASYRFTPLGGVVGRSSDCDWVIPDQTRHLSGRHAIISFDAGQFFITDISTNGTYLNGLEPLTRNVARLLHDEDRLLMGELQLRVRVLLDYVPASRPLLVQPLADNPVLHNPAVINNPLVLDESPMSVLADDRDQSEAGIGSRPRMRPYRQSGFSASPQTPPPASAPVTPIPAAGTAKPVLRPVVNTPELEPVSAVVQVTVEAAAPNSQPVADSLLAAFASGAGLPLEALRQAGAEAVLQRAGALLRLCVQGLVTNAQARASMKNEFHLDMTLVNARDNNPLKFAANADQVLRHLLADDPNTFMPLEAGVQECFDDVLLHQQAMLAGMRGALDELLLTLSPAALQQKIEQQRKGPSLRGKDARCWQSYRELHRDLQAEENLFDTLFADAFSRAYEEQVLLQKKSPPKKKPPKKN